MEHYLPIRDFLYEDEETLQSVDTFDEEYEDNDFDHLSNIEFSDPIEIALFDYVVAEQKKKYGGWGGRNSAGGNKHEVAAVVLAEYGDKDADEEASRKAGHRVYTPTINDPRQMSFDFDKG